MTKKKTLTAERLKELFDYDPLTGVFYWKQHYHRRFIGGEAGHIFRTREGYCYRRINVDGRLHFAHRLAFLFMTGEWPPGDIDHKDRNGLNNIWKNLRAADKSQNKANSKSHSNNRHGYKGVTFNRNYRTIPGRWEARIGVNGKRIALGTFDTPEAAHAAYAAAAQKYFGEFARVQ